MTYEIRTAGDPRDLAGPVREIVRAADFRLAVIDLKTQAEHIDQAISTEITLAKADVRVLPQLSPTRYERARQKGGPAPLVVFAGGGISSLRLSGFGVAPALRASVPNLMETLKLGGRGGSIGWGRNSLRSLLVVSEIALSLVALVGAGLFIRSMRDAQQMDPGFESKNLFMMAFDLGALHYEEGRAQQFFREAVERANATPGVKSASIASNFPLGGGLARTVFPEGESESTGYRGMLTQLDDITPGYFDALRIPLKKGRVLNDSDRKDTTPVAVINEAMAKRYWPQQDALGQQIVIGKGLGPKFEDKLRTIIGIFADTRYTWADKTSDSILFRAGLRFLF